MGIVMSLRNWRLSILLYIFQLTLLLSIGLQVYHVIDSSIGTSLETIIISKGFDYTIFHDLINVHGSSISPLIGQLRWLFVLYLLLSAFVNAGVIFVLEKRTTIKEGFWRGSTSYFFRFLIIGLLFFFGLIIWSLIIWIPYFTQLFYFVEHWVAEYLIIWLLIGLIIIYFLGCAFLFCWSLNTRIILIRSGIGIFKSLVNALRFSLKNISTFLGVMLIYAIIIGGIYWLNFILEWGIGMSTPFLIMSFLLFQQFVVLLKIAVRVATYSSFIAIKH